MTEREAIAAILAAANMPILGMTVKIEHTKSTWSDQTAFPDEWRVYILNEKIPAQGEGWTDGIRSYNGGTLEDVTAMAIHFVKEFFPNP